MLDTRFTKHIHAQGLGRHVFDKLPYQTNLGYGSRKEQTGTHPQQAEQKGPIENFGALSDEKFVW